MTNTTVKRAPASGISVLISGAGVGGLMTALECWRKGFDVRIFEKAKTTQTHGDSFTIGPSALDAFKNWPDLERRNREISYYPMIAYHNHRGERLRGPVEFTDVLHSGEGSKRERLARHTRPLFHAILLEQLTKIGLQVEYDREVVEYFEDQSTQKAGVVLKNGLRFQADLVVAADGGRGHSWSLVAGHPIPVRSSGLAIFRACFPIEVALADPIVAERFPLAQDGRSIVEAWGGPDMNFVVWRNEDTMQWGLTYKDSGDAEESWGHRVSPQKALNLTATIPEWPEVADRLIKMTPPDQLVDWKLMWRDPQPKWTSPAGLVVQLGDAAHTLLPTSGNGGTQAMEDAVSLATCLSLAGEKANIQNATRVHNLLRFERCSFLQAFGVVNAEKRNSKKVDVGDSKNDLKLGDWITEHDPEQYALDNYEAALAHLTTGEPFRNTNTPPGAVYRPWTIDSLKKAMDKGEPTILDSV